MVSVDPLSFGKYCSGKERLPAYYEITQGSEEVLWVLRGSALARTGPLDIRRSSSSQGRSSGY